MAYFDTAGEDSERLLVGWSPTTGDRGRTGEYLVSEMDREGNLVGAPLRLQNAGWGEDNLWQTMPNSGCVVFPFAHVGDAPGQAYPNHGTEAISSYPNVLHMTAVCPQQ